MNRKRIKAIYFSSLKVFWQDKGSVFWVIAWPIMLVVLSAFVFIPPSTGQPIQLNLGVINNDTSNTPFNGEKLVEILKSVEYNGTKLFNVTEYHNITKLKEDVKKNRIDAAIIIPEGFGEKIMFTTAQLTIYVGGDSLYSIQINKGIIQGFFYEFSKRTAIQKVNMSITYMTQGGFLSNQTIQTPMGNISQKNLITQYLEGIAVPVNLTLIESPPEILSQRSLILGWYVLGAVGMVILYTGFMIGATAIIEEKEKGRLDRILSSPTTPSELLLGKMLFGLTILLLASMVILLTGYGLGAKIRWSPTSLSDLIVVIMFILIATMTINIGFLISLLTRTEKSAGNIGVMLGLILSFTAGIWFPKDWLPQILKGLANVFPITWGLDVIRNIMVYQIPLTELATDIARVMVAALVLFIMGVVSYKKTLSRYAEI